jgi:hypothetical protein
MFLAFKCERSDQDTSLDLVFIYEYRINFLFNACCSLFLSLPQHVIRLVFSSYFASKEKREEES